MTKSLLIILLTFQLTAIPAIRVYTGTAVNNQPETENKITKRSWSNEASQPGLYKVKLTQRGYVQFLRYLVDVPSLQQYTFCAWIMSTNYTYNHPIFSYSRNEQESLVKVWLNPKDSTLRATFKDEPVLRVPVNFREGRWYHICQSWSGITGEWAVYIDGKVKSHDRVNQHIGTTLPGGGDIAVGQELTDFNKGLDDGIEGEIFGFNLVDQAVLIQNAAPTFAHYRPEIESKSSNIPQFKKLPNMRKSFEEIKGYLSQLPKNLESAPADAATITLRPGELPASSQPRRVKPRTRNTQPLRKVIVYREERMNGRETKRVNQQENAIPETSRPKINQVYDAHYNVHAFKGSKILPKTSAYKIHEAEQEQEEGEHLEEAATSAAGPTGNGLTRRPRQNFDVNSLWEANRLHPFYTKLYEPHRSKYHFEQTQQASRRTFNIEPILETSDVKKSSPRTRSALPDVIPVYEEIDESRKRRKRDTQKLQTGGEFRRLPALPDEFVKLLTPDQDKETIMSRLSFYIGNSTGVENLPPAVTLTGSQAFQRRDPQYFPNSDDILLNDSQQIPEASQNLFETHPQQIEPRLDHDITNTNKNIGNELVSRSYSHCGVMRGSPLTDKRHLIISWADTPVRIYGGAIVTNANNVCGYF